MIKKEKTIMLQQVMTNPGEIIFREVPVPEVKENQVLVKIMNIGVCGSDIHVYHGKHPFTKYPVNTICQYVFNNFIYFIILKYIFCVFFTINTKKTERKPELLFSFRFLL